MKIVQVLVSIPVFLLFSCLVHAGDYSCLNPCTGQCAPGDIPCIIKCSDYQKRCCKDKQDICAQEGSERTAFPCNSSCESLCPEGDESCINDCNAYQNDCCQNEQDICIGKSKSEGD